VEKLDISKKERKSNACQEKHAKVINHLRAGVDGLVGPVPKNRVDCESLLK
jgi:hypothetical protein